MTANASKSKKSTKGPLCTSCRCERPLEGLKTCRGCLDDSRQRWRDRRAERLAAHQCLRCGKPPMEGKRLCHHCTVLRAEYNRKTRPPRRKHTRWRIVAVFFRVRAVGNHTGDEWFLDFTSRIKAYRHVRELRGLAKCRVFRVTVRYRRWAPVVKVSK